MVVAPAPVLRLGWLAPVDALAIFEDAPGTLLLSGGASSASYLYPGPARPVCTDGGWSAIADTAREALKTGDRVGGLIEYEAARLFEPALDTPKGAANPCRLFRYPAWVRFDPEDQCVFIEGQPAAAERLAARIASVQRCERAPAASGHWAAQWPKARYLKACVRALEHIRAGDIYQTNLSQPFAGALGAGDTPFGLFRRLLDQSPAPFGAYFRVSADRVVVTNSPERFVKLDGGQVETRPIKGTRPRGAAPEADRALARELASSIKDRAENLMIVDLMRHDLSRVCEAGSISVPELFKVESFANVHHLVSTVRGQLGPRNDALDLIAAAFPPGSITGAPKIRAMEILGELEGEPRGAYCGALGWIGAGGQAMDLNVMIRTLTLDFSAGEWLVQGRSGGAITIDSDSEDEYLETLAKASALKKAVAG